MSRFAIEPHASWLPLEARAESEPSERRRTLLAAVRDHMEYEIKGQLDPLMATLTAEPVYHFRGRMPAAVLEGYEAVRGFYADMFANNGQQFEVVLERIVADDGAVVTEGQVKQVYTGAALKLMGVNEHDGRPVGEEDLFVSNAQLITVWPGDPDGKLVGEDIYFGEDPIATLRRITRAELPPYHHLA